MSNKTKRLAQSLLAGLSVAGASMAAIPGVSAAETKKTSATTDTKKSETGKTESTTGQKKGGIPMTLGASLVSFVTGGALGGVLGSKFFGGSGAPVETDKDGKLNYNAATVMGILGGRIKGGDDEKTAALRKKANSALKAALMCVAQNDALVKMTGTDADAEGTKMNGDCKWLTDGAFVPAAKLGDAGAKYMLANAIVDNTFIDDDNNWQTTDNTKVIDFGGVELPADKNDANAVKAQNYVQCRMVAGSHNAAMALKGTGLKITWKKFENNLAELEGELGGIKLKMTVDTTKIDDAGSYKFEEIK